MTDTLVRTFERRFFEFAEPPKVRAAGGKQAKLDFEGEAIVYGQLSVDMGGWQEIIDPGAATRTLANNPDVRFLRDHLSFLLLGRTASGTLELAEQDSGVRVRSRMANVSYAHDAAELIERGDLTGMSFGFWIVSDAWSGMIHHVREVDLDDGDVSVVTYPAFPQTSAALSERAQRHIRSLTPDPRAHEGTTTPTELATPTQAEIMRVRREREHELMKMAAL